jgi:hypothetical protein
MLNTFNWAYFAPYKFIDKNMKTVEQAIKDIFLNKTIRYKLPDRGDTVYETGLIEEVLVNIPNENTSMYDDFSIELHHSNTPQSGLCTSISLNDEFEII